MEEQDKKQELSETEKRPIPETITKEIEQGPRQQPSGRIEDRSNEQRVRRQRQRPHGFKQEKHREGRKDVSVVIPLLNEEQSLPELYEKLRNVLHRFGRFEIIFVDDGSSDGSNKVLHDLRRKDRRIKIIRFRRNFGKSAALSVGFDHAEGDVVITMDADLQDDPDEIPNLINELKKGYDLISGWKKKRRDPLSKTIPSRFFNFVTSLLTGIRLHDFNCGLKVYRNEVVKDVKIYGELHRYIPALAHWLGYRVGEIVVQHQPRKYGKSKYGVVRFWRGFLDLLTVLFTTRYLKRPLHLFGFWGSMFFLIGFIIDLYLVYLKFAEGMALSNRPLFLGGILLIIVGIQFISIGLLGELITKTYHSTEKEYSIRDIWK
ncbi:MAG: glycosyltransferase family 2 protein [Bacteroidota bacterium]|nr:glycosyltransferase family 2 protein [Bacteroidota bacterium]